MQSDCDIFLLEYLGSMTISFSNDEDDSQEKLNSYIHSLLGFHDTEDAQREAWDLLPTSTLQSVLSVILRFQKLFGNNFIADRWQSKIQKFMGNQVIVSTTEPSTSRPIVAPPRASLNFVPVIGLTTPSIVPSVAQVGVDQGSNPLVLPPSKAVPAWQRYAHSIGGSLGTVPTRRTKPKSKAQLKQNDFNRALRKLGSMDAVNEIRESWSKMDTKYGGLEWRQSEGIVINLVTQGLSQKEIRALIPVGGFRTSRLKKAVDSDFADFHTKRKRQVGASAVTSDQLEFLKTDANSWKTEDGFPCAHRRPRTYLVEENVTWTLLHQRYREKAEATAVRVLSLSRWTQLIHYHFSGLRLSRSKEDVCDACVRLETQLISVDLSDELRVKLELEKSMHIQAAIDQRHTMSDFVKLFVKSVDSEQAIPDVILEDCLDSNQYSLEKAGLPNVDLNEAPIPTVLIQAEDFGGSLALPHYGFNRPSADYFNSNLILHQFVTCNINENTNKVWFYDERGQGKGADALCSLRMRNLLELLEKYRGRGAEVPAYLINILDNCVGQNKSNTVLKFFALVSLLLFEKVVLLYLIPGHSHMKADRVVAWCKGMIRGRNMFCPIEIAKTCDEVKGVSAEFLDHRDSKRPFFVNWDTILDKYFKNLPVGFTGFYFFEFDEGIISMKHLASSPESEQVCVPLIQPGTAGFVRSALLNELFGVSSILDLSAKSINTLRLPRHLGIPLTAKKILSISKKYFSIPACYVSYFPDAVGVVCSDEEPDCEEMQATQKRVKKKVIKAPQQAVGARQPGRPKKVVPPLANQKSIMGFFAAGSRRTTQPDPLVGEEKD